MSDYTILTSRFQPADFAPYEQVLDEFILPISLSGDFIIPWKYLKESVWSYTDDTYSEAVSSAEYLTLSRTKVPSLFLRVAIKVFSRKR